MLKIEEIKHEIEELTESDFAKLRQWIAEKDWQKWDREIERDSESGRLDFLINEAKKEKEKGNLEDL